MEYTDELGSWYRHFKYRKTLIIIYDIKFLFQISLRFATAKIISLAWNVSYLSPSALTNISGHNFLCKYWVYDSSFPLSIFHIPDWVLVMSLDSQTLQAVVMFRTGVMYMPIIN